MISGYKLVYSPTSSKRFRYKVKIKGDESDCRNVIKHIGPICGSPFNSLDSEFKKAFYVYGSSEDAKNQIERAIDSYLGQKEEQAATARPPAEEIPPPAPAEEKKPERGQALHHEPARKPTTVTGKVPPPPGPAPAAAPAQGLLETLGIPPLNKIYTFENMYEGSYNRFLKQACQDIAREFTPQYNPLFIWGGVGRGKTHLIQAIGNFIQEHHRGKTVLYIQAQDLMMMIQNVKDSPERKTELVKNFSLADALLIDDIQFLEGDVSQDVFFLIFERAYQKNSQIVITADRSPKQLSQTTDRLRSRFEWGLVNKIQKPGFEEREGILKLKIEQNFPQLNLNEDMVAFVAGKFEDNIRELEGVLKKVNVYSQLTKKEITMESLTGIVAELLGEETEEEPALPSKEPPAQKEAAPAQTPAPEAAKPAVPSAEKKAVKPAAPAAQPPPAAQPAPAGVPGAPEGEAPPPPSDFPPPPPEAQCPNCGAELSYIDMYDRWYCYSCKRYAPPDYGKGKFGGVLRSKKKKNTAEDKEKLAAIEELKKIASSQSAEKEPIKVIEDQPKEEPKKKEEEKPAAKAEAGPKEAAKIKFTRVIQCAIFYPAGSEKAVNTAVGLVKSTVEKHRLHINFEFIVRQDYDPVKLNYSAFINILNTAKIRVALVIGPPKSAKVSEDEFYEKLSGMFVDEGLCFEYIALKDIKQSYEYLNVVLDIANFGKQRFGYKVLKEEFDGKNIKKR